MLLEKDLVTEAIVDNHRTCPRSGFSAHGAVRVEERKDAVRLGRYMIRCPIAVKRLRLGDRDRRSRLPGQNACARDPFLAS